MGSRQALSQWMLVGVSLVAKQRPFILRLGANTIGKGTKDHLRLRSRLCSRQHCCLYVGDDEILLFDAVSV